MVLLQETLCVQTLYQVCVLQILFLSLYLFFHILRSVISYRIDVKVNFVSCVKTWLGFTFRYGCRFPSMAAESWLPPLLCTSVFLSTMFYSSQVFLKIILSP